MTLLRSITNGESHAISLFQDTKLLVSKTEFKTKMIEKQKQDMSNAEGNLNFKYWHVWTDDDGVSHQTQNELTNFQQESMGGDAAPQWNNHLLTSESNIIFAELPVDWVGEWHENPQPQWIVPLSGVWFVETMDGQRVEMGVGEFSFGGDQNTKPNAEGKQGHLSGTVGNKPCRLMIIQLKSDRWVGAKPEDFK